MLRLPVLQLHVARIAVHQSASSVHTTTAAAGATILLTTSRNLQDNAVVGCSRRSFATSPRSHAKKSYKLLVVGAGTGGSAIANKFASKLGKGSVAVLDPSPIHYYQPMFTLVGAGIKKFKQTHTDTEKVLPKECDWIRDKAAGFDPDNNTVTTENGDVISYDFMVVAMGLQLNFNKVKGLAEALESDPRVCSNYSPVYVKKTFPAVQNFKGGNAIFTMPSTPIKCPGAPQKICYLVDEYFTVNDLRGTSRVIYNTALPVIFGIPRYADALWEVAKGRKIEVNLKHNLIEVRPDSSEAVFELVGSDPVETKTIKYALLHASPPCSTPKALWDTPLVDETGFVNVDRNTLQHVKYPNVFSIGDCANLPISKTAAGIAGQSGILGVNLQKVMDGHKDFRMFDGYTSCPLTVTHHECILAEFGYDGKIMETFPFNQAKPRISMFHLKSDIMPIIYWKMLVKGWWHGPGLIRKILHLGMSK